MDIPVVNVLHSMLISQSVEKMAPPLEDCNSLKFESLIEIDVSKALMQAPYVSLYFAAAG